MQTKQANYRDLAAGLLFIAIGLFFALNAWLNLRLGTGRQMGPGFFPIALGLLLLPIGVAICVFALRSAPISIGTIAWRGVTLITLAIIFFSVTVRGLGFAPALGIAVWLAAYSTDKNSLLQSLAIAVVFTALSVAVFLLALGLPFPILGPWIR